MDSRCSVFGGREYELMKTGWFDGQRIAGYFETREGHEQVSRLLAALKDAVKGRKEDSHRECQEIVVAAGLPEDWVGNMLATHTLMFLDLERNYSVRFDENDGLIWIPSTFGQQIVLF